MIYFKAIIFHSSFDLNLFLRYFIIRFTIEAVEALQVASEAMIVQVFEDSVLIMVHSKRITLLEKDVKLARRSRGVWTCIDAYFFFQNRKKKIIES